MAISNYKLSFLPALLVFGALAAAAARVLPTAVPLSSMEDRHDRWMAEHGKVYENAAEKAARFEIFKSNMEHIESFNARKEKYWLGPNQFTDLTNQEFKILYSAGYRPSSASVSPATRFRHENATVDAAASLDWRSKGAVTPIKDQGHCGACWAFSSVAAIESINQIKNGKLVSLSEQELIDCDFIVDNHGINSEANYPFAGEDGSCNSKKASVSAVKISGFEDVPENNEAALLKAVTGQPVSVAINGGDPNFQSYAGGIFTGPCDTKLDHAVTAIGYGTDADGTKYWLVKNSWGTSWGNNGYIKMERDISSAEGLCGLAKQPSYPTIN
ncbi:hypothetical protein KSP40_PGU016560 [Platanthera guangdongensis]|uniref:Uncharacterized protein n=1 Tax=Platanthera guangdongensis TaxID=2320717 RepID=A0ABR2MCR9_9ASPA